MFYSHEILASPQYGVATVWLVGSLGVNAPNRKLTRKVLESVNVPRACETISEPPGAPIALRLQATLLFGVTTVYSKHWAYLEQDLEKTQTQIRMFSRNMNGSANTIDTTAGKAKRKQLILLDDPDFLLDMELPALDFDDEGNLRLSDFNKISQRTWNNQSQQFSPMDRSRSLEGSYVDLNLRHSSSSANESFKIAFPFGKSPEAQKPDEELMPIMFGEDEELPFGDFGLAIDADGNVIEEPELPPHRPSQPDQNGKPDNEPGNAAPPHQDDEGIIIDGDGDLQMNFGEEPLPDAEPLPARQQPQQQEHSELILSSESAAHPARRKPRRIKQLAPDAATHIGREEFKGWSQNYLADMEAGRNVPHTVTAAQSKKNAFNLLFGMGLGGIGLPTGIPGYVHPLAELFAGEALRDRVLGRPDEDEEEQHGRRRSASVAFEEESEEEQRKRPRLEGEEQQHQGRSQVEVPEDDAMIFGDDVELGREPRSALSDQAASVPWNRPPSVVPSSARSNKAAQAFQGGRIESSPLVGRGSNLPEIERFSDNMPNFGSDGPLPEQHHSSFAEFGVAAGVNTQEANTSQFMREALDREGRNFLGFMERVAAERGEDDETADRRWVEFDGLFEIQDKTKPVVAQAFLHILTLATKGQIRIMQQGVEESIPFGEIRVGVQGPFRDVEMHQEIEATDD